jgi:rhomboid protease GluP
MVRRLIDDFREFPATMTLGSLWVVVFALMVLLQVAQGDVPAAGKLILGLRGGHPFGELTISELYQGEIWRPLTATFVHYGLLHLAMNLFMLYQLGPMVETWYGSWQFLAVYVLTGYGGNLLSALARHAQRLDPSLAAGGGSTVVLGLVALCAVVGWRSHTRTGLFLRNLMVGLLVATALLGRMVPIIDNWGHAGGALIGAAIGFAHRILIRTADRPVAKWIGGLAMIVLLAAGLAQTREGYIETRIASTERRWREAEQADWMLQRMMTFYVLAGRRSAFEHASMSTEVDRRRPSELVPRVTMSPSLVVRPLSLLDASDEEFRAELKQYLDRLDALRDDFSDASTAADFQRLRTLLARVLDWPPRVLDWPPSDRIVREFLGRAGVLIRRARQNQASAGAELEALAHARLIDRDLNRPARSPAELPAGAGGGPSSAAKPR